MKRPWEVSRRSCLRGAGTLIGLPFLEAMLPGVTRARAAGASSPKRVVFFVFTGGTPETSNIQEVLSNGQGVPGCLKPSGASIEATALLESFADPAKGVNLLQDSMVISNLHNSIGYIDRSVNPATGIMEHIGGDHQRSELAILTQVNPFAPDGPTAENKGMATRAGISIDQVAANALKQYTPLPSLYLSNPTQDHLMCWKNDTQRLQPIELPSAAFRQIFGNAGVDQKTFDRQKAFKTSVLHHAKADTDLLKAKLGKADRMTLDKYLTSINDLETQIAKSNTSGDMCAAGAAHDDPADFRAHWDQMVNLLALAFQCDLTRVATVQMYTHGMWMNWAGAPYDKYPDWHGDIEHGANAFMEGFDDGKDRMDTYVKGAAWQYEQFGNLVRKLKTMYDPGGTPLLDNTVLACTSGFSYGNGHTMHHLPMVVAGGKGMGIRTGRHLEVNPQPVGNLWMSMLNAAGVPVTTFGENSTEALSLS